MKKGIEIGKYIVLAFLLIAVMQIVSIVIGLYFIMSGQSLEKIDSNQLLSVVTLIGEVSLPLFMLLYYRKRQAELKIVMPFKKESACLKYSLSYLSGIIFFFLVLITAVLLGGFTMDNIWNSSKIYWLVLFFIGYGIQGLAEEIVCRGYLEGRLLQITSKNTSILLSALFFSSLHILNNGITIFSFFELFVFGLITGIVRYETNSLWVVAAFHSAWNFAQGPLFGVSVSGAPSHSFIFESTQLPNKEWLNGGDFGIEGSLTSLSGHLLLLVAVILWSISRHNKKHLRVRVKTNL